MGSYMLGDKTASRRAELGRLDGLIARQARWIREQAELDRVVVVLERRNGGPELFYMKSAKNTPSPRMSELMRDYERWVLERGRLLKNLVGAGRV